MLTITLLGTAATMPLPERALTAAVAECGGHSLLLDCGEGTQTAARRAGVNLMRADAICLTHYHGDHIFGLPGLLQTQGGAGAHPFAGAAGAGGAFGGLAGGVCSDRAAALRGKTAGLPRRAACGAGCSFGWMARRGNAAAGGNKAPGAQSGLSAGLAPGGQVRPGKGAGTGRTGDPVAAFCSGDRLSRWQSVWCSPPRCWARPARGCGSSFSGDSAPCPALEQAAQGGRPAALRCHLCPAGAAGAGRAVGAQHLWPKRSAGGKSRGKAAVAGALFPHGHRPGGASCTGAKHLPGGRMRL